MEYSTTTPVNACSTGEVMSNAVQHPRHYTKGGVECIDAIRASMTDEAFAGYCKGNVLKYIFRYEDKGGVEDLDKANVYLGWLRQTAEKIAWDNKQREY